MPSQLQLDIQRIDSIESDLFRDMVWLIYSDNISKSSIPQQFYFSLPEQNCIEKVWQWYESIKHKPIKRPSTKLLLGKYNESIFASYFSTSAAFQLIKHSLQLVQGKTTIGELDYLLKDRNGTYFHLEIAIKYYLKTMMHDREIYLGPSTNDWLQRKLDKLINKQLLLTQTDKTLLPQSLQAIPFVPKLILKGSLFHPYKEDINYTPTLGWWISLNDIFLLKCTNYTYNIITEKRNWIFPYNSRLKRYSFSELKAQSKMLLNDRDELMITRFDENKNVVDRGFIVRKDWPH